ncbi:MAG: hypothetical protein QE487_19485 [Fluviicola sp.]|nr:hypothetical protein [Fluviicola sp.]
MRSSLEQFERVSDYVSGKLTESQRGLFELEMSNDPFLQEQVAFQKDMVRVVERRALRSEIGAVASVYAAGGMSLLTKLLLGTGSVLVIGVLSYFIFMNQKAEQKPQVASVEKAKSEEHSSVKNEQANIGESKSEATSTSHVMSVDEIVEFMRKQAQNPSFPNLYGSFMTPPLLGYKKDSLIRANSDFVSIPSDSLISELLPTIEQKRAYVGSWRNKPMTRAKIVKIKGLRKQVKSHKKAATVYVTDEEGNILNNAKMTYSYFGEQRTVAINGVYAFDLYSEIKTTVVIELENGDKALIENVDFKPKYITYIEIDGYSTTKIVKRDQDISIEK